MRLPLALILVTMVACVRAYGASDETSATPAVLQALPALNIGTGSGAVSLNLGAYIGIPGATGQVVQLNTTLGKINIELRADKAPATVANFLRYVNSGAYDHLIINRLVAGFVFQTGAYTLDNSSLGVVQSLGTVVNEFNLSNTRGTLAMAKVGPDDPNNPTPESINSATNQWFINLADNDGSGLNNLNTQNGGFTAFAQVLGTGMQVADAIAALPAHNVSGFPNNLDGDFTSTPLRNNYQDGNYVQINNLVMIDSLPLLPFLSAESTNPAVINASITGATLATSQLILTPKAAGTAAITVRAADTSGHIVESTAIVSSTGLTVGPGQVAVFRVANTVASTFQWQRLPVGSKVWVAINDTGGGYTGTTTAILTVPANLAVSGDQYHCVVITAGKGKASAAQLMTVTAVAPSVARQGGPATITGGGAVSGTTYFAKGLPAGLTINASTGQITGTVTAKPGIYTFTTWSQIGSVKSAVASRTFVVQPFLQMMTGAFEGLLVNPGGVPLGKVGILVTATGAFTGTLTHWSGFASKLKGVFTLNSLNSSASASLSLGGGFSVSLSLDRNAALTGSFTIPVIPVAYPQGEVDTLVGGVKTGGYGATVPAPWAGTYAMALGDVADYNPTQLSFPKGAGHATAKIATTGIMQVTGKLPDGTVVTGSFPADASATYRPFMMPYKRAWSFTGGFLPLSPRSEQPSTYHVASGQGQDFYWVKNGSAKDKVFPSGFGLLGFNVSIEPWTPVSDVTALATKLGLGSGRTLTLVVSCLQWTLDSNGNPEVSDTLSPFLSNQSPNNVYSLPVTVTLAASGKAVVLTGTGTSSLTATVNLADGSFTGTMKLAANGSTPARTVPLEGSFLQLVTPVATNVVGQGFFLLPGATKTDPTLGGLIKLSLPAAPTP